jgi:2-phospho-L-lactate guanylyltransferase (CobY/MobA/RfbA family)
MRRLFEHVSEVMGEAGLEVVALTEHGGLNMVVARGLRRVGLPALVAHADLPALTVSDVARLLDVPSDVAIARSVDGGTNGLLLRSGMIDPAYGVDSAHVHASRARRAGLSCRVVDVPGFARDIDDPASLIACGASFLRPRS